MKELKLFYSLFMFDDDFKIVKLKLKLIFRFILTLPLNHLDLKKSIFEFFFKNIIFTISLKSDIAPYSLSCNLSIMKNETSIS